MENHTEQEEIMTETTLYILTQIIGYVALGFGALAFQCKKHKNVMLAKTANELFFCVQYFLLGAYTGMAMNLVSSLRNLIFARQVEKGKSTRSMQILFSVFFVIFGLLTWQGTISIIIILAKIVTTVAYGIKNTRIIRALTLPTSTCWLIYNYLSGSGAGVICEILSLVSIITAMIRIELIEPLLKRKSNKTEKQV